MGRSIGTSSREIELQVLIESRSASRSCSEAKTALASNSTRPTWVGKAAKATIGLDRWGSQGGGAVVAELPPFRSRPSRLLSVTCRPPAHPPTCSSLHLFTCSPLLLPTCPTAHLFRSRRGPSGATWERARDAGKAQASFAHNRTSRPVGESKCLKTSTAWRWVCLHCLPHTKHLGDPASSIVMTVTHKALRIGVDVGGTNT